MAPASEVDISQDGQRLAKRRTAAELGCDVLRVVFEFANLASFVFWPNVTKPGVLSHVARAVACALVSRTWCEVSRALPTCLSGQPPETFGNDACGELHKRAFWAVVRMRTVETLDLYTLGNHAKAPPDSGRTRIELEPLLALPMLKTLRLSASAIAHGGRQLQDLALVIASSHVRRCAFRLKTGDQKPKALVVSPYHRDQPLDKLAEAILTTPSVLDMLAVRYEQREGTLEEYNRSLVIERRDDAPRVRLRSLVDEALRVRGCQPPEKTTHRRQRLEPLVRLDSELTLLFLYSTHFAELARKMVQRHGATLALKFDNRMSETELRRFQRLARDVASAVGQVRWTDDEARGSKVINALRSLRRVGPVKIAKGATLRVTPSFEHLVEVALTGEPRLSDVPLGCRDADVRHTVGFKGPDSPPTRTFDFSKHVALRRLVIAGHGALWVIVRLPPRAHHVALEAVEVRSDAYVSIAEPRLDVLRLQSCFPVNNSFGGRSIAGCFSLPNWLLRTGVKECHISDCDHMNWSLGADFDELCHALRRSRIQRLRLSALLASGSFEHDITGSSDDCSRRSDALIQLLDTNLRPQFRVLEPDRSELQALFNAHSSVFFDLYYRSGGHYLERQQQPSPQNKSNQRTRPAAPGHHHAASPDDKP